jgi:hypothetical protein
MIEISFEKIIQNSQENIKKFFSSTIQIYFMQESIPVPNEFQSSKFKSAKISSDSSQLDTLFSFFSDSDQFQDPEIKLNQLTFSNSFSEDEPKSDIHPEDDNVLSTIKEHKKVMASQELNDLLDYLSAHYDSKENRKPKKVLMPTNKGQDVGGKNMQTVLPFVVKGVKNFSMESGKEGKKLVSGEELGFFKKESLTN